LVNFTKMMDPFTLASSPMVRPMVKGSCSILMDHMHQAFSITTCSKKDNTFPKDLSMSESSKTTFSMVKDKKQMLKMDTISKAHITKERKYKGA